MTPARSHRSETGETLIELLMTIAIMGIAFAALLFGVATAYSGVDTHRQEATAEGVIRNLAEWLEEPAHYQACGSTSAYDAAVGSGFSAPSGWTVTVTGVEYRNGGTNYAPTFGSACASPDAGIQRIALLVQSPHTKNGASETASIVTRVA